MISLFQDLKAKLAREDRPVLRFATCMGLHKLSAPRYYAMPGVPKQAPAYTDVSRILASALDYLKLFSRNFGLRPKTDLPRWY